MTTTISAVIPTKNRPEDLRRAVLSILSQSRLPDQLVIIDQSESDESRDIVGELIPDGSAIPLVYVLDTSISGLVDAKRHSLSIATGDLICFLEDDIELEESYFEEIVKGFAGHPQMLGCCAVATNVPVQPAGYQVIHRLFHRGIFEDKRVGVFGDLAKAGVDLIQSDMISGGISAWKREVFDRVKFDVLNGFHIYEDNDFSTRVAKVFGARLYINPRARLQHHMSPRNRSSGEAFQERKIVAQFTYFKKRRDWPWATLSFVWLMVGQLLEAGYQSLKRRSWSPLVGYLKGLVAGMNKKVVMPTDDRV
jgi:GT2 family glycosyltransferase